MVDAIEEEEICNETAASRFGIPSSTLHRHATSVVRFSGRNGTLVSDEEERIIDVIVSCAFKGMPMTLENLREAISLIVCRRSLAHRFMLADEVNLPSMQYFPRSRRNHAERVKVASPTGQEQKRFVAANEISLTNYFATLEKLITDNSNTPSHIFNLGEMGVTPNKNFDGFSQSRTVLPRQNKIYFQLV